jgi:hypothetical protein
MHAVGFGSPEVHFSAATVQLFLTFQVCTYLQGKKNFFSENQSWIVVEQAAAAAICRQWLIQ